MAGTDNPATLLKNTILSLMDSGRDTVAEAWTLVLGVGTNQPEFARRHAEVVALFGRVYDRIAALPDQEVRDQYLGYVPTWYGAIVYRRNAWDATQPNFKPVNLADRNIVNHLTGLAATFELYSLTTPPLDGPGIEYLEKSIAEWRKILDDPEFDQNLAVEIRADVDHIAFLLSERGRFGSEPVVKAARDLIGTAAVAMGKQRKWAPRIGAAMAGVVIFLHGAHNAVDDATGILEGVVKMWNQVEELTDPQKQIEQRSAPELEAGAQENNTDEIVDAETVDPEPPTGH